MYLCIFYVFWNPCILTINIVHFRLLFLTYYVNIVMCVRTNISYILSKWWLNLGIKMMYNCQFRVELFYFPRTIYGPSWDSFTNKINRFLYNSNNLKWQCVNSQSKIQKIHTQHDDSTLWVECLFIDLQLVEIFSIRRVLVDLWWLKLLFGIVIISITKV